MQLPSKNLGIHWDSNSQNKSSLGSVRVHFLTLFCIPKNIRCDSRASFLARNLASPCLGREPKARVATLCVLFWFVVYHGKSFYRLYIASFLKRLEEKNIIKENKGAHIITVLGHTIRLLIMKGDGGFNYVSTSLGCLWYMLMIIVWITKKPIQLNISKVL